jgi:hypothetical protein
MSLYSSEQNIIAPSTVKGAIFVLLIVSFWLAFIPLYDFSVRGVQAIFRFYLQDTFYYLSVARNSVTGFYTFDGEFATSGFHPLWQWFLTELFRFSENQESQIQLAFFASVFFVTTGYILTSIALYKITKSKLFAILIIPGIFNVLFWGILQFAHSPWSYMNGMESPFTVFFLGFLFVFLARYTQDEDGFSEKSCLVLGIICCFLVLSRLDDVFLVPAFISVFFLTQNKKTAMNNSIAFFVPILLGLLFYLAFNQIRIGMLLPISGVVKGGFALVDNLKYTWNVISLRYFDNDFPPVVQQISALYRLAQLFVPAAVAIFCIAAFWRKKKQYSLFIALMLYVLLKALYNLINVDFNYQGVVWYFVLSVIAVNASSLVLLSQLMDRFGINSLARYSGLVTIILCSVIYTNFITMVPLQGKTLEYNFWNARNAIRSALLSEYPDTKLIEYDDGIINFSLGLPTLHGLGFVLDAKGMRALRSNELLFYGYSRGFNTICSLAYIRAPKGDLSSDEIKILLRRSHSLRNEYLDAFEFKIIFIDKTTGATFIRLEQKQS